MQLDVVISENFQEESMAKATQNEHIDNTEEGAMIAEHNNLNETND